MLRAAFSLTLLGLSLSACAPQVGLNSSQRTVDGLRPGDAGFTVVAPGAPVGPDVDSFAIGVLNGIQARSIAEHREYCGYIWQDQFGRLQATDPIAGTRTGCVMQEAKLGAGILASYHSHAAYDPNLTGEIPSRVDLVADFNYGMNGYVSTPAGRVWLVDVRTQGTRQLCGPGCVISDPRYVPPSAGTIRPFYSINELR